jgi:dTDP-4-amino-4,6-dideoxy-D-galactose acyltransferase
MIEFKHLEWDSEFFERKIGKLEIGNFTTILEINNKILELQSIDYQLIYLVSSKELFEFENNLKDKKVTFSTSDFKIKNENINVTCLSKDFPLEPILIDLALQSGEFSRFKLDEDIPKEKFVELYRSWIANSLNHIIADEVIVFNDDEIKGLVSYKIKDNALDIGLIAVDTNSRGKNIGTQLINYLKNISKAKMLSKINVVTQLDNKLACNFYRKNNFEISNIQYIYHIWKL